MLELYKTDSDGKLNKEIDNEGTSLDKTKFFYKTADESEYRKKNTLVANFSQQSNTSLSRQALKIRRIMVFFPTPLY